MRLTQSKLLYKSFIVGTFDCIGKDIGGKLKAISLTDT